ncbi:hypothetical protein SDJN03_03856, partial [Cucurbita argyrosperma subsp. sororia]
MATFICLILWVFDFCCDEADFKLCFSSPGSSELTGGLRRWSLMTRQDAELRNAPCLALTTVASSDGDRR